MLEPRSKTPSRITVACATRVARPIQCGDNCVTFEGVRGETRANQSRTGRLREFPRAAGGRKQPWQGRKQLGQGRKQLGQVSRGGLPESGGVLAIPARVRS